MWLTSIRIVFRLLFCAALAATEDVIKLEPSASPPKGVSMQIDPAFAGFGIEPSNLFSFMGEEKTNNVTLNLLNNLAGYAGKPPHIRIGGNTQDYMIYRESQSDWAWNKNQAPAGQGAFKPDSMLIGPRFFEAANRFPKGATVTWGLNLAYEQSDYIDQITTMAKQVLSKCSNLTITSFEIGNEPDLYLQNEFQTGSWGGKVCTQQWLDRASAIYKQVLQPRNMTSDFFEAAATASTIGYPVSLEHLVNLHTTEDQFAAWAQQVSQAQQTSYSYALREMGVVGPIGLEGVTDVFGAAIWTLNFLLYTASLNITSIGFHMTDNSNASAWQPIAMYGQQPHVRPLYYGIAAFDQVIGSSCPSQVSVAQLQPTQIPSGYQDYIRAYPVYANQTLASVVIINGKIANSTQAQRDTTTVQLQLPPSLAGKALYLSYLSNSGADAKSNTTWNGLSFEHDPNGTPMTVADNGHAIQVASIGIASISLRDSEAVVANIGSKIGGAGSCSVQSPTSVPNQPTSSPSPSPSSTGAGTPNTKSEARHDHCGPATGAAIGVFSMSIALVFGVLMLRGKGLLGVLRIFTTMAFFCILLFGTT
ncbi:uncharacterized protein F4822DRAFT_429642 [Hypoxylon trugodes]|uniref:uncharacterized protein n=1 Tax=Hypoxylon trugodes TaxID=326681 RepID=UPI00218DFE5F|nr:uncharacterized protein F4822DRAFT_429642 [Hypoxylon trugodes]KAI1389029.1 hypothetical protein F4822DRAFT_429642 [Hypoxylon trugodes]